MWYLDSAIISEAIVMRKLKIRPPNQFPPSYLNDHNQINKLLHLQHITNAKTIC